MSFLTILFLYFVNYNYDLAAGIQSQRQPQLPFIGDTLNGVCTILRLAYRWHNQRRQSRTKF
jgi:hypothetical protein